MKPDRLERAYDERMDYSFYLYTILEARISQIQHLTKFKASIGVSIGR